MGVLQWEISKGWKEKALWNTKKKEMVEQATTWGRWRSKIHLIKLIIFTVQYSDGWEQEVEEGKWGLKFRTCKHEKQMQRAFWFGGYVWKYFKERRWRWEAKLFGVRLEGDRERKRKRGEEISETTTILLSQSCKWRSKWRKLAILLLFLIL